MKDEEEFGEITLENEPEKAGWNKPVPEFNSLLSARKDVPLNKEQEEFYQHLKECIKEGKYLWGENLRNYLQLYADELSQAYKSRSSLVRDEALQQIVNFVTLYNYSPYEFNQIIDKERNRLRQRRLSSYRLKEKAAWVPVGQELVVDGWKFVRGGFYWGKFVEFSQYNPKTKKYTSPIKFEGPALSLIPQPNKFKLIGGTPNCFGELNPKQQDSLFNWLAGSNEIDIASFAVYLSGFEVRLLGDKSTSDEERIEDIRYLYNLLNHMPLITDDKEESSRDSTYWQNMVNKWITKLIDFTLARYFTDNAETVLPSEFVEKLPMVVNTRIDRALSNITITGHKEPELAEDLKQIVKPPCELPEIFHQAFYEKLASEYLYNSRWHLTDFGMVDRSSEKYEPIYVFRNYQPNQELDSLLTVEPLKFSKSLGQTAEKLKLVYSRVINGLQQFRRLVGQGAPLLQQINSLPSWCDTSLLPEVQKIVEELSPSADQKYKLMKVSDLVKYFISTPTEGDGLEESDVDYIRMSLKRLGLSLAYPTSATMKLKYDDTTAIYPNSNHEVPSRGTISTSMFLIAWMIQPEKVTDADYAVIDQWLGDAAKGSNWDVSAQAVMRWLVSHKLTLTAKRKIRVRALKRFANKRDQLLDLLLVLVNGEGFVLPKRMKRLATIYELIGLDPSTIHSDLHRLATEGFKKDAKASSSKTKGGKGKALGSGSMLNRDKLKEMEKSTAKAQEILADVFTEPVKEETHKKNAPEKKKKADSIVIIIEKLAQKPQWTRSEFEELISKEGETVGAMLEKLNDYSYDKADQALIEDDGENLYVDTDVASELLESI